METTNDVLSRVLRRQDQFDARCRRIEEKLGLEAAHRAWHPPEVPQFAAVPIPAPEEISPYRAPVARAEPLPSPLPDPSPPPPPSLEAHVGLAWLNRIGVVTLILGFAFAFKTAVDNDWIGPAGRVGVGLGAAALALLGGDRLWNKGQRVFAHGLTGLGCALTFLSLYAAFALYHLLGQELTFALMTVATAGATWLALRYRAQAIAVLALIGGYLTPILLSQGSNHALVFLAYVALLNTGALVLARRRAWSGLEYLAGAATVILFAGWLFSVRHGDDRALATVFLGVFYAQLTSARTPLWFVAHPLACLALAVAWPAAQVAPLLVVLAACGLAVAELRGLRDAPLVSGLCFWAGYGAWVAARSHGTSLELLFLTVGFAVLAGWLVWCRLGKGRALRDVEVLLLGISSVAYYAAAYGVLEPTWHPYVGGFTVLLAAAHFGLARIVWEPDGAAGPLAIALGLALFTLALPIQLAGASLTIGWAVEGAALAYLAARYGSAKLAAAAYAALAIAAGHLLAVDLAQARTDLVTIANPRFLAFAVTAAALFATTRFQRARDALAKATYIAAHGLVLLGCALEIHTWAHRSLDLGDRYAFVSVGVSILLAIYAFALVTLGVVRRSSLDRILGLTLVGGVVAKLYLVDVWGLDRAFRIAAFLGLGVLLLAISYLYSHYRSTIERLWKTS